MKFKVGDKVVYKTNIETHQSDFDLKDIMTIREINERGNYIVDYINNGTWSTIHKSYENNYELFSYYTENYPEWFL